MFIREDICFEEADTRERFNREAEGTMVDFPHLNLTVLCMYIPPQLNSTSLQTIEDDISLLLDEHLMKRPNRDIIVNGDFNNFNSQQLELDFSLTDIVKKPTRGNSILDHMIISENLKSAYDSSKMNYASPIGRSDHLTLLIDSNKPMEHPNNLRRHTVYDYRKSNIERLLNKAVTIDWRNIVNCDDDLDAQCTKLHEEIIFILHDTIPHENIFLSAKDKCWMTPLTKKLINEKWAAYKSRNWSKFKHLKEKSRKEIFKAKALWAMKQKRSTHGLWKMVRKLSGKETRNGLTNLISQFDSPQGLAEKIAESIKTSETGGSEVESDVQLKDDVWNLCFSEQEIEQQLRSLSPNKAAGLDLIPNRVYATLAPFIAPPLKTIFDTSISRRIFPSNWKKGVIVPLPKTNPPLLTKLRTITLLPSPSKILERLILAKSRDVFGGLIGDNQHAFRKGASTTTALIQIVDTMSEIYDYQKNRGHAVISLDFSKAFDRVDHHILLQKMKKANIPTGFLIWLKSYLSDRTYQVRIQGQMSGVHNTKQGVPQGSVLGPVLFASLVGDLYTARKDDSYSMVQYADDANIIIPLNDTKEEYINEIISEQLDKVQTWCVLNKQELNSTKTKIMISVRDNSIYRFHNFHNITNSLRILGLHVNSRINWDDHVNELCKKSAQRLHLLRTIKPFVEQQELHDVYTAVIRAQADYCCPVFVKLSSKLMERLRRIEKRAHRIIFADSHLTCSCEIDGFQRRRESLSVKLMEKILRNGDHILVSKAPTHLANSNRLSNFTCRTTTRQNTFFPYTTLIINQITNA